MELKNKALIIGCGNIGALYDIDNNNISNHARALQQTSQYEISFCDEKPEIANYAASQYGGTAVEELNEELLNSFAWISICTPTNTHFSYLQKLQGLDGKLVMCEKPITYARQEIAELKEMFGTSSNSIFVNYFRRFLPCYSRLKTDYADLLNVGNLQSCKIEYCRGLLNNASHGFDLIEFLFDRPIVLSAVEITSCTYDAFENDPTMSFSALWEKIPMEIVGRNMESAPVFNITLSFEEANIQVTESGNCVRVIKHKESENTEQMWNDCMKDYMKYSVQHAMENSLTGQPSNYGSSLSLNSRLLDLINIPHNV